uniref:Uncharacterized protein n=1 Tax=Caenorhabditis japonica TaxID=281687 RepID=A0A8R1HHK3_CAEJA
MSLAFPLLPDYTPPSTNSERHGMNYNEYKNAMSHATPEPTIPPPTEVHSPGMPVDYTTIAPGAASTSATMRLKKDE